MNVEAASSPLPDADARSSLRDVHLARVVEILRLSGPMTQADLVRRTGLTRPTVASLVRLMRDQRTAMEVGLATPQRAGRPGALLAYNPRSAPVAVGRMMSEAVDAFLGDAEGQVIGHLRSPNAVDGPATVQRLAEMILQLQDQFGEGPLRSATVLLPGRVDPVTGTCVAATIAPDIPVRLVLQDLLSVPVTPLNPGAASALGIASEGNYKNALVVFLDQGLSSGLVTNGKVVSGSWGGAGALGHSRIPSNERRCRCGERGCLETLAAGWAIRKELRPFLDDVDVGSATLAEFEALGDPRVDVVLQEAAFSLGLAASWLVNAVNPSAVLLGGTPFTAGADRFLQGFRSSVIHHSVAANVAGLEISFAGDRADLTGAFRAALATAFEGSPQPPALSNTTRHGN